MIPRTFTYSFGKAKIPKPGGDKSEEGDWIHFIGFQSLGQSSEYNDKDNFYNVKAKKLKGCYMLLDEASVTGTANIVIAAVLAEGKNTIYNAACEPYLQQL